MKSTIDRDMEKELVAITSQLLTESGQPFRREIKLDMSLQRHLGIDSLGRAELFQRIEKAFDVSVPDRLLAEAENLNDIASFLREAGPRVKESRPKSMVQSHGEKTYVDLSSAKTLLDILLLYASEAPDKPHIYFQNEHGQEEIITYHQLLTNASQVANGLRMRGLKDGETVAIMQPTHPAFFYTFFGTLLAGGVPVPIYPPFRTHMLEAYAKTEARILRSAEVRILVTFDKAENLSRLLQAFVPSLRLVTTVDELIKNPSLTTFFHAKADDFAFIQYTSGSTSDPKGVLLTHYNLLSNVAAYGKAVKVTPDDVAVSWLPLYHDMGLIGMWLGSLYHGVPLILMTPFSFLNHPERWLWAIHYHRGTLSGAPNFAYELCIRKVEPAMIEGLDLSSWRVAANGAEKVYPRTLEEFTKKFAPYGFKRSTMMPVYGLAESTVGLAIPPVDRDFRVDKVERKRFEEERLAVPSNDANALEFVGCGMAIEGHDIRIVDDEYQVLPERHIGNLQFRGPSTMQGYYNNSRATQAVFHQGWVDSGDLAYLADKEVFITGRRKDLIIKAGRNLYPAEMEEVVGNVPEVRQGCVAAFGVTDGERGTEQIVVVAEVREKTKANHDFIIENINEAVSVALDIVPDHVILVAPHTVPKTSSGKLQRAACKAMYLDGKLGKKRLPAWLQIVKLGVMWFGSKLVSALRITGELIYTAYMAALVLLTLIPVYLLVLLGSRHVAATTCRWWMRFILRASFCPIQVEHAQYLTMNRPVIFVANHASYIDALVLLAYLPANTRFVAKKEVFSVPVLRTFMYKLGCFAIDRTDMAQGLEDTKPIESSLKAGESILMFPEGTFGYAKGLRPFRLGAFKLSAETNVPICPVALNGTRVVLRDSEKLLQPGKITITVCEPVMPDGKEWQDITQLKNVVRAEIALYCGEESLDLIAAQIVAPKS